MSKVGNFTCRICLTKYDKPKKTKTLSKKLVNRIEDITGIKLKMILDYPKRICADCLKMLDISLKFREMCRSSETTLLGLDIKPELKTESQETVEKSDEENPTIDSDHHDDFFGNFVDCREVNDISEIADISMEGLETKPKYINENEGLIKNDDLKIKQESCGLAEVLRDQATPEKQPQKFPSNRGRKKAEEASINNSIMCEICGNIYKQRNLLNMHMRRHLEHKPYDCEICGKSFACASEIRRHMRTHTGEKPYICKFCGRTFADRSTNIKHERTHTNTRPFQCTTCGKSFTYSNVLKNHMLTHTGEKNFPCLPCNKTFSRKHQLDQHFATITHQQTIKCLASVHEYPEQALLKNAIASHQQATQCLANNDLNHQPIISNTSENHLMKTEESNIILDNRIIVQPLLLISPKMEEESVNS